VVAWVRVIARSMVAVGRLRLAGANAAVIDGWLMHRGLDDFWLATRSGGEVAARDSLGCTEDLRGGVQNQQPGQSAADARGLPSIATSMEATVSGTWWCRARTGGTCA
jgi:hypothetical protein